ncbi:mechanosensitive ion channel family protein [Phormidium yuhuli AB48]|uniref:Mechanosensitive ion channel family protein n=1 Tax=Phormidium yuhuli AB48 TaxID=2940671 RepID=A0ABY5AP26_9CYAN|nr:mechanosensitive ion channel domain-containing protein [Phormidium yuhuli]USR90691.1 mechanosensitive ion channel family protein [Phormidium yuhuli AB48]
MLDYLPEYLPNTLDLNDLFQWSSMAVGAGLTLGILFILRPILVFVNRPQDKSSQLGILYRVLLQPNLQLLGIVLSLTTLDVAVLRLEAGAWLETPLSLGLTVAIAWFLSRVVAQLFDVYLLDIILRKGSKINELLNLGKLVSNLVIIIAAIFIFAQTHQVNLLGLLASLGIGGLAVAFAAQKTLEQVLGGIVLYLDKPFTIDDYVGLPDGTFGRVESIGLRSTKIRCSGKGTLMIIPNGNLTQMTVENFTGGKKVMAILYLNFQQDIPEDERALIRQVIIRGTSDIFGIDSRNTDVTFKSVREKGNQVKTQAQTTFFILGSGSVSMEIRRQVLDVANQKIAQQLKEYGVLFDIEEPTIYVDSPITI